MLINKKSSKNGGGTNSGNKSKIFNQIVTLHQNQVIPQQNQVVIGGPNMSLNQVQQIYINQNVIRPTSVGNSGASGLSGN